MAEVEVSSGQHEAVEFQKLDLQTARATGLLHQPSAPVLNYMLPVSALLGGEGLDQG